jgi:hypothetical protein
MTTIYRVNANELSLEVINSIKEVFKDKLIDIIVTETPDETNYILSNKVNAQLLFESIDELESGRGINFTVEELQAKYGA